MKLPLWLTIGLICFGSATARAADQPEGAALPEAAVLPERSELSIESLLETRDPFRPPVENTVAKSEVSVPELQRYDVNRFRLIGVITGAKKNRALLTTPDGKMHVVGENITIGTRKGIIKTIAPGKILVEEKVMNLLGREERIETVLEFERKDKGNRL